MFETFEGSARIWIFAADQVLSEQQCEDITGGLSSFLETWAAHGKELNADSVLLHKRFAVVCANESEVHASGCSLDSLFRSLREIFDKCGAAIADSSNIFYQDGDEIYSLSRPAFKQLVEQNAIAGSTPVFDNSITTLSALKNAGWRRAYKDSWHSQLFGELS